MRHFPIAFAVLILATAAPVVAERGPASRWLPEPCQRAITIEPRPWAKTDKAEARWNRFYSHGIDALSVDDLATAETAFCHALDAARWFEADDIRFAETLDELGLVYYSAGNFDASEAMQGAAASMMLLATGPPVDTDLREAARKSCKSSLANYVVRLGWIYDRQGRAEAIEPLIEQPYRLLALGYVPDVVVLDRLDWLISRYLLDENHAAARTLQSWRQLALDRAGDVVQPSTNAIDASG